MTAELVAVCETMHGMFFHLVRAAAVIVLLGVATSAVTLAQTQQPNNNSLQIIVTALTKNGTPAVVTPSELSVLIDKTPAPVMDVRSLKEDPLLFAVLVDISKSDASAADEIKGAAIALFEGLARGTNQGFLVLFNDEIFQSKTPAAVPQVREALNAARFRGGTAVYDAVELTSKQILGRSANPDSPRRAIFLISDGEDNASHVTHTRAEEAAQEEAVTVFTLVTRSSLSGPHGANFLKDLSQLTGGMSTDKQPKQAVSVSLAAIDAQWLVTFAPTQPPDGKVHKIELKNGSRDAHVTYVAPHSVFY